MPIPTSPATVARIPQTCLAAGGVLGERDGHSVVASYGSISSEIAVCMKSVGLADHSDLGTLEMHDVGATIAIISVIGPRAGRLMTAAALPGDLPIGAVGRDRDDPSVLAILHESQRRLLLLVREGDVDALWGRLLAAGEPLGAAFVGCDALALLGAAPLASDS